MAEEKEEYPECTSKRTVQMGRMAAVDLKCVLTKGGHYHHGRHRVGRIFGDVYMIATWGGDFEE